MTLTACLYMAGDALFINVSHPHNIQVWGLASFIFVGSFHNLLVDKREQASHFFCVYPYPIVKQEYAKNPVKSRFQLKLIIFIMSTLRFSGYDGERSRLKEGMFLNVPTDWATDFFGRVSKDAIQEIMEALEEKGITIHHYDWVFDTDNVGRGLAGFPRKHGWRADAVLRSWKKV